MIKSWSEITIEKYLKIYAIFQTVKEPMEQQMHLIAELNNISYKEIEKMQVSEIIKKAKSLKFLNELPTNKLRLSFKINRIKFKPILFHKELSAGQFIDFSSICDNEKKEDVIYHMHELIAAMCKQRRNVLTKYKYEGYESNAKLFYEQMPMTIAYPYFVFFCEVMKNLLPRIEIYLKSKAETELKMLKKMKAKMELLKQN